jgi:DNA topoisomerase-3
LGKRLVIAEKPSVARDICAALGGFTDHGGDYYESDAFVVTFALGHLLELAEPEDYDKTLRAWTLASLPIIPDAFQIRPKEGQKKRLDLIRKLGSRDDVEGLINACDAGREGEVIFRRIIEWCDLAERPHQRLWLQSMTPAAIRDAFAHLRPGAELDALADAAWLRGVGDWLIGMNSTRALTRRLKGRREKGSWSAGRVQTPTLGLLVAREREILAHVPRTFWEIEAQFHQPPGPGIDGHAWSGRYHDPSGSPSTTDGGDDERGARPGRLFDRARVDRVLAATRAVLDGGGVVLASEKRKRSRQNPPLPFDLTTLQRDANKRFSFSARRTLNAAQRLYEVHKVLTYPRTDSRHLPDDWRGTLDTVLAALAVDADYRALAKKIDEDGPQNLDVVLDGSKVTDHFAIVPTGVEPPDDMGPDDRRIYDIVVRQFLASIMGPATWAVVERQVEVAVPADAPAFFRTTARSLEIPGFLEALGSEEGRGTLLPALAPGQDVAHGVAVALDGATESEKETKPPTRHNEAALLRLMETAGERMEDDSLVEAMQGRGLGTPATRADIIERLITTGYATRIDNRLAPTPKGMRLMDILERAHVPVLASPRLTGEWEFQLKQVEAGKVARAASLDSLTRFTREVTDALAKFDHDALYAHDAPLGRCPSCQQGDVVESVWGYRCSRNDGDAAPCRFFLWKEKGGRYVDRAVAEALVHHHKTGRLVGFSDRFGHALEGRITLEPEDAAPGAQWAMKVEFGPSTADDGANGGAEERGEVLAPCPCGDPSCLGVVETNQRFVCQRLLDGLARSGPVLPRTVCGRAMEVEEALAYFGPEGRTATLEAFTSKRGRPFSGALIRKETGKHGFEFPPRPERPARGRRAAVADVEDGAARPVETTPSKSRKSSAKAADAASPAKAKAKPKAPAAKAASKSTSAPTETAKPRGGASKAKAAAGGPVAAPKTRRRASAATTADVNGAD